MRIRFLLLFLSLLAAPALAQSEPGIESLSPVLQTQARDLWSELRCVVCQGQSVAESNAPLAGDMRNLVVERLQAGETPEAIRRYLVERYGTQILLNPPLRPFTWPLWFAPLLFLLLGGWIMLRGHRRRVA